MALSHKEQALRIIEQMPEDISPDDLIGALTLRLTSDPESFDSEVSTASGPWVDEEEADGQTVTYHLEREGHVTVLVPDRPVPPLKADVVNRLIEEMRKEREDRWLYPSDDGD